MAYNVHSAPKMKSVRSKAEPGKRDVILIAMLDLVGERGFHDAPMSVLAKKAGVSAGIIYHYSSGKEELIRLESRQINCRSALTRSAKQIHDG
jgi:hypothetical protein